jgi:hypothetical protein
MYYSRITMYALSLFRRPIETIMDASLFSANVTFSLLFYSLFYSGKVFSALQMALRDRKSILKPSPEDTLSNKLSVPVN